MVLQEAFPVTALREINSNPFDSILTASPARPASSKHPPRPGNGHRGLAQRCVYGDGLRAFRARQDHPHHQNRPDRQRSQDVTPPAPLRRRVSASEMVFPSRYQAQQPPLQERRAQTLRFRNGQAVQSPAGALHAARLHAGVQSTGAPRQSAGRRSLSALAQHLLRRENRSVERWVACFLPSRKDASSTSS